MDNILPVDISLSIGADRLMAHKVSKDMLAKAKAKEKKLKDASQLSKFVIGTTVIETNLQPSRLVAHVVELENLRNRAISKKTNQTEEEFKIFQSIELHPETDEIEDEEIDEDDEDYDDEEDYDEEYLEGEEWLKRETDQDL